MDKKMLLLEISTEEMPSRNIPDILNQLKELAITFLKKTRIAFGEVQVLGTPRRLALLVSDVATATSSYEEKKRGPSIEISFDKNHQLSKAGSGFAHKQQVRPEDLIIQDGYIYAKIYEHSKPSTEIFKTLLPEIINNLHCSSNMRWGNLDFQFIRPLRWIVALFGDEIIPFEIANIKSSNVSYGHRCLSDGAFNIKKANEYIKECEKHAIIVDQNRRREMIIKSSNELAISKNGIADITEDLLEEIVYLVECPTVLIGEFNPRYLLLPNEVIVTFMRNYQRYFPVKTPDGQLMPFFIAIHNSNNAYTDIIKRGNEKVLRARLEDALFFFNEDRQHPLKTYREKLSHVVFQDGLGNIYDKTERLVTLIKALADKLNVNASHAIHAAKLCKADLVTNLVIECPTLQGIIGGEYAKLDGEDLEVQMAIKEHYLPKFAGDVLPQTITGKMLSVVDKIDNIVAAFSKGAVVNGSCDVFALRRQTLGLIQIIITSHWNISINDMLILAMALLHVKDDKILLKITAFIRKRIKSLLNSSISYDIIDAVSYDIDNVSAIPLKATAIKHFLTTSNARTNIQSFIRVSKFSDINHVYQPTQSLDTQSLDINTTLFQHSAEHALYHAYKEVQVSVNACIEKEDYLGALNALTRLVKLIDVYFDEVMIMDKDLVLRQNRLILLNNINELFLKIADFKKIILVQSS